jgi:dTDP-4-dehydrorhamnose reductase
MPKENFEYQYDLEQDIQKLSGINQEKYTHVFLCAAITGFSRCMKDPSGTRFINIQRTIELAQYFLSQGSVFVYLSSSAVFDGANSAMYEKTQVSPITEYGRQKAECEKLLTVVANEVSGKLVIVRLTKVVDPMIALYEGWRKNLKENKHISAFIDLSISPITTDYVVENLQKIALGGKFGIFHLSGHRDISYYDLATHVCNNMGHYDLVKKDWIDNKVLDVQKPSYSSLGMERTTALLGIQPQRLASVVSKLS